MISFLNDVTIVVLYYFILFCIFVVVVSRGSRLRGKRENIVQCQGQNYYKDGEWKERKSERERVDCASIGRATVEAAQFSAHEAGSFCVVVKK